MTIYREYTTLTQVRKSGEGANLNIATTAADTFLLALIREVSADVDALTDRTFVPLVTTQYYDCYAGSPWGGLGFASYRPYDELQSKAGGIGYARSLRNDKDDWLEVVTLTNGDGTDIPTTAFNLYPANSTPKNELRIKQSAATAWLPDSDGNTEQVIVVNCICGYHDDYPDSAWHSDGTLASPIGSTTATSFAYSSSSCLEAGMLVKLDGEILYASSVGTTTATITRGVNGSTASTHTTGTRIYFWKPIYTVERVTRMAVAANWNLRANPEGKQVSINGVTFSTPNSIEKWMAQELEGAGLPKAGMG